MHFRGSAVHPGYAKDILVNAIRLAADFVAACRATSRPSEPRSARASSTRTRIAGDAENVEVRLILRDHDEEKLEGHAELVRAHGERRRRRARSRSGASTGT